MQLPKKRIGKTLAFLIPVIIIGCATSSRVTLPSGEVGYTVSCDGSMVNINLCYEKAGEVCPNGYEVINQSQNSGWIATSNFAGSTNLKGIIIKCKDPKSNSQPDKIPEEVIEITDQNLGKYERQVSEAYRTLKDEHSSDSQKRYAKRVIREYEPKINIYKETKKNQTKLPVSRIIELNKDSIQPSPTVPPKSEFSTDSLWHANYKVNDSPPVKYRGEFETLDECKVWGRSKSEGYRSKAFGFAFECLRGQESFNQKIW